MSWRDALGGSAPELLRSDVESRRFGLTVDRLSVGAASPAGLDEVRELIASSHADLIVLRYPSRHVDWFACLADGDRRAIFADMLVYWALRTGRGAPPAPASDIDVEATRMLAAEELSDLIRDIFSGYTSHYSANPMLDDDLALAGYQEWAISAAARHDVVVARRRGTLAAVATMDIAPERAEILLAGVGRRHQGAGVYPHLLRGVEQLAEARGIPELVISTQGHNAAVQRLWARYGLTPVDSLVTVHLTRPSG